MVLLLLLLILPYSQWRQTPSRRDPRSRRPASSDPAVVAESPEWTPRSRRPPPVCGPPPGHCSRSHGGRPRQPSLPDSRSGSCPAPLGCSGGRCCVVAGQSPPVPAGRCRRRRDRCSCPRPLLCCHRRSPRPRPRRPRPLRQWYHQYLLYYMIWLMNHRSIGYQGVL